MTQHNRGWKALVQQVVSQMPVEFSLAEILEKRHYFQSHYPNNRFVDAKIRQSLQILRDQGVIEFLQPGKYRRIDAQPAFSPLLDVNAAAQYTARAQAARVLLETWAQFNLYCLNCTADNLEPLPANTPVADFSCLGCSARYQLKGKDGRFGARLTGAAYGPTMSAARKGQLPEYILVEFDTRFATVVFVDGIPGVNIGPERIAARKPLGESARRAGWQGCTIDVSGLERARIVQPQGNLRTEVRTRWAELRRDV